VFGKSAHCAIAVTSRLLLTKMVKSQQHLTNGVTLFQLEFCRQFGQIG